MTPDELIRQAHLQDRIAERAVRAADAPTPPDQGQNP